MAKKKDTIISQISTKLFGWMYKDIPKSNNKNQTLSITDIKKAFELMNKDGSKVELPSNIDQLYQWWINKTGIKQEEFANRLQRYADMDEMYYGSPYIWKAVNLVADETIQADSNEVPITIEAKKKIRKEIEELFENTELFTILPAIIHNLVKYGDAALILSTDEKGINKAIRVDPKEFKERMEFVPYKAKSEMMDTQSTLYKLSQTNVSIKDLVNSLNNEDDWTAAFEPRLFGFVAGDYAVPPWKFIHFRMLTNEGAFDPYGMPMFIHAIATYRQLQTALEMAVMARAASFPIDKHELNFPNVMDPTQKVQMALMFMEQMENMGIGSSKKEGTAIGEKRVTIKDLYEHTLEEPGIKPGDVDDVELLLEMLEQATGIPRAYLDPSSSGFGMSGVALTQQWKPFARMIYKVQSAVIAGISLMIKIHLMLKGYDEKDIDFVLSMPYPESQTDRDIIGSQSDLLRLANEILDAIRDKIGGSMGDALPIELVKMVYSKILPYDDETIQKWIKQFDKDKEDVNIRYVETPPEQDGFDIGPDGEPIPDMEELNADETPNLPMGERKIKFVQQLSEGKEKTLLVMHEKELTEKVQEAFMEKFQDYIQHEKVYKRRHWYSSRVKNSDVDIKEYLKNNKKKLNEIVDKIKAGSHDGENYVGEKLNESEKNKKNSPRHL